MPKSAKPLMIDGFTSVRAATRRPPGGAAPKAVGASASQAAPPADAAAAVGTKFQHTVMPARHEIVCYHCGYAFVMHGKLMKVFCTKCRQHLATDDRLVDSECADDIRTLGTVSVATGGVLRDCEVAAGCLRTSGDVRKARRIVCGSLTLEPGCLYDMSVIEPRSVLVSAGARLTTRRAFACRGLDVHGAVKGTVTVEGITCIHAGAVVEGRLKTRVLHMEDGATMNAVLSIGAREVLPKVL